MRRRSIRGNGRSAGAKENVDCWAVGERGRGNNIQRVQPLDKRRCEESYERSGHHSHYYRL